VQIGHVHGDMSVVAEAKAAFTAVDEVTALAVTVARQRRRSATAKPLIVASHPYAALVVRRLSDPDAGQVLVIHGRAGSGKSTVVADVLDELVRLGWAAAAVRMDEIDQVTRSAFELGERLRLSDSPLLVLGRVAGDGPAVLVVDQLDAVSRYSGRMPDSYDAIAEMLDQAEVLPGLKIVLVVRTVDMTMDMRMRSLLGDESRVDSIEVGDLEAEAVEQALRRGERPPAQQSTSVFPLRHRRPLRDQTRIRLGGLQDPPHRDV
jgi:hypothetical protein